MPDNIHINLSQAFYILSILLFLTCFPITTMSHTLKTYPSSAKLSTPCNKEPISFSTRVYNRHRYINQHSSNTSFFYSPKLYLDVHPNPGRDIMMVVGIGRNSTSSPMLMTELIVDTASGFTWLQGFPCDSCYKQGDVPYYNSSASKSFDPVYCQDEICQVVPYEAHAGCSGSSQDSQPLYEPCSYNVQYYDRTNSSGVIGTETFYLLDESLLGSVAVELVPFGVGTSNYFPSRILSSPGVAGFARGYGTLLNKLGVKKFSHCFPRDEDDTGIMSFGEEAKIKGIKLGLDGESERYEALLTNLYVSGERIVVEYDYVLPANMVFDTGTSWTHLTPELVDAIVGVIKNVLRKYQPRKWGTTELCYNMTDLSYVSLDEVAKVTFEFNYATKIDLFSFHLWLRINEINLICLGLVKGEENVFGNNLMREMNIGYTLDKDDFAMYFNRQHCLK